MKITVLEFIAKWHKVELRVHSATQEHFIGLCDFFDHLTPGATDPTGDSSCFEKGAAKHEGGDGFGNVWKRGFFDLGYKARHKGLGAAYNPPQRYRGSHPQPRLGPESSSGTMTRPRTWC